MEAHEIESAARVLGNCNKCRQRQVCSWSINGGVFCETCADQIRGIKSIEEQIKPFEPELEKVSLDLMNYNKPSGQFALKPAKTINLSIGILDSGYVLNTNDSSHVFPTKAKLIKAVDGLVVNDAPMDSVKWPKEGE
tara:strand:- start:1956 stop:2366 length:411 start_codon:yes stop_codon:yes gene_type:complete